MLIDNQTIAQYLLGVESRVQIRCALPEEVEGPFASLACLPSFARIGTIHCLECMISKIPLVAPASPKWKQKLGSSSKPSGKRSYGYFSMLRNGIQHT